MSKELWFKRKRYGWGWTPANAKGWIAILVYTALALLLALVAPTSIATFIIGILVLTVGLIWLCYKKGETPRWSWGDDSKDSFKK